MATLQTGVRKLPKEPVDPTEFSPKVLMLYGMPKVGKTEILSTLPEALTIDLEGGTNLYRMVKERAYSTADIMAIIRSIEEEGRQNANDGKTGDALYPYKFLAIDTVDMLEDFCITSATNTYKKSAIGANFKGDTILELAHGGGYYYLREAVKEVIYKLSRVCKHLILISHVNDKNVEKDGTIVSSKDISMSGKLKIIIPSLCDAIGYLHRKPSKTPGAADELWVNFRTSESATMGSRYKYLAGQNIPFDWKAIYPDTLGTPTV